MALRLDGWLPSSEAATLSRYKRRPLTCSELVRPLGFEPRTCGLRVRCSAIELEAPAGETYGSSPRDTDESSASLGTEGDRRGSNPRPPGSQPGALTN